MAEFLKPKKTNPRGIPEAPFIERVEDIIKDADLDFENVMKMFQERLQQYKYMEVSKRQQLGDLKVKIPDIEKNLQIIDFIQQRKQSNDEEDDDEDEGKIIQTNYELNDTLYTKADIDTEKLESVYLWLGADVMLDYPLDEAVELLKERLENNNKQLELVKEDLVFLKENITTMEVNTARLYNWDVERKKKKDAAKD